MVTGWGRACRERVRAVPPWPAERPCLWKAICQRDLAMVREAPRFPWRTWRSELAGRGSPGVWVKGGQPGLARGRARPGNASGPCLPDAAHDQELRAPALAGAELGRPRLAGTGQADPHRVAPQLVDALEPDAPAA